MAEYRITEWSERYEVNSKGQPARKGDELRVKPLEYIRQKVNGRSQGSGYRKLLQIAGVNKAMQVFGIFQKFLEIAGDAKREDRGFLPASNELAFLIGVSESQVKHAIEVMLKLNWIVPEIPKNTGKSPQIPAAYITEHNITEHNITEHNIRDIPPENLGKFTLSEVQNASVLIGLTPEQAKDFYDHYNSQGWIKGNNLPITDLASQLSNWKRNNYKFEGKKNGQISGSFGKDSEKAGGKSTAGRNYAEQQSKFGTTIQV